MGKEKELLPIKEAFQLAQQPHQNQAKAGGGAEPHLRLGKRGRPRSREPASPSRPLSQGLPATLPTNLTTTQALQPSDPVRRGLRRGPLILWRRI